MTFNSPIDPSTKPLAILVDFDGTITIRDIGVHVIENFAEPGWREAEQRFYGGEINVRELWQIETSLLREDRHDETVNDAVKTAEIRQGFGEFIEYCRERKIPVEVASSGMDLYVDPILEKAGFADLPKSRPATDYDGTGHGVLVIPEGLRDCGMTAMCKCDRVWNWRRKGYRVAFIGDGASDECAVTQADLVFATSYLKKACTTKGIEHVPFDTFDEILAVIRE